MSREWQQTKYKQFVMPDAVYYQCLWAVRDLERMEKRRSELIEEEAGILKGRSMVSDKGSSFVVHRPTEEQAVGRAVLEERIKAIREALEIVPEEYRSFILSNIILMNSGKAYPNKIWKYWKQRFLYNVAKNLSIM
mgnify:CR=1 FL=1